LRHTRSVASRANRLSATGALFAAGRPLFSRPTPDQFWPLGPNRTLRFRSHSGFARGGSGSGGDGASESGSCTVWAGCHFGTAAPPPRWTDDTERPVSSAICRTVFPASLASSIALRCNASMPSRAASVKLSAQRREQRTAQWGARFAHYAHYGQARNRHRNEKSRILGVPENQAAIVKRR
jgi:hypothetical protein